MMMKIYKWVFYKALSKIMEKEDDIKSFRKSIHIHIFDTEFAEFGTDSKSPTVRYKEFFDTARLDKDKVYTDDLYRALRKAKNIQYFKIYKFLDKI